MERDNLFRGFDKDNGVWIHGGLIYDSKPKRAFIVDIGYYHGSNNEYIFVRRDEVDWNTVGQFTGLFDKRGTKIFEGDILKIGLKTYSVIFDKGCFWAISKSNTHWQYRLYDCENFEVIGNIHQNPELLNQ